MPSIGEKIKRYFGTQRTTVFDDGGTNREIAKLRSELPALDQAAAEKIAMQFELHNAAAILKALPAIAQAQRELAEEAKVEREVSLLQANARVAKNQANWDLWNRATESPTAAEKTAQLVQEYADTSETRRAEIMNELRALDIDAGAVARMARKLASGEEISSPQVDSLNKLARVAAVRNQLIQTAMEGAQQTKARNFSFELTESQRRELGLNRDDGRSVEVGQGTNPRTGRKTYTIRAAGHENDPIVIDEHGNLL